MSHDCTATITVGGTTVECDEHEGFPVYIPHGSTTVAIRWGDDVPGAEPSRPRFYVEWSDTGNSWRVYDRDEPCHLPVASIYDRDRRQIAHDLADRLNDPA